MELWARWPRSMSGGAGLRTSYGFHERPRRRALPAERHLSIELFLLAHYLFDDVACILLREPVHTHTHTHTQTHTHRHTHTHHRHTLQGPSDHRIMGHVKCNLLPRHTKSIEHQKVEAAADHRSWGAVRQFPGCVLAPTKPPPTSHTQTPSKPTLVV